MYKNKIFIFNKSHNTFYYNLKNSNFFFLKNLNQSFFKNKTNVLKHNTLNEINYYYNFFTPFNSFFKDLKKKNFNFHQKKVNKHVLINFFSLHSFIKLKQNSISKIFLNKFKKIETSQKSIVFL